MKRILSMLLLVCMVLTPLPSAAAGSTVVVSDATSLKSALTSSASGTIVQLAGDISFAETITVPSSLTLDLNGRTLTYTGTDSEKKLLMVGILFTGSGTFTVKDSGTDGKLTTSETYSVALRNTGSGIMELADGAITTDAETASAIVNTGSGTIKLSGATVESKKYFAVINQLTSAKLNMSSGTVSSESGYAIENRGVAEISGGTVSSITSIGISNNGSGSLLTVSGGTVESISGYAIANSGNGNTVKVTGGMVSSESSAAIANFNSCEISGGTVSTDTGMAVANVGGNLLISNGATVNSNSGTTIYTTDNLTITGGTVNSDSGVMLFSEAPVGRMVTVSGGTLSSTSGYCAVNNAGGSMTISGTAVLSTASGSVSLVNQGTGTAIINGGTMTAAMAELYNSSTGKIEINAGTYALAVNSNASGSIVINGGSIKAVQGATPINSAGIPLSSYGITLTNGSTPIAQNTPIAAGELILTPAVSYGFNGVKTDASGTIYLWLPATVATANYKSGSIDVSGSITAGKTSVLPNYKARVTVKRNGETWNNPFMVLLLNSNDTVSGADIVIPDGNVAKEGGVYEFSGLKPGQDYYIWGNGTMGGLLSSGVQVNSGARDATVNFYNLNVTAGGGIDGVFMNATLIQGTDAYIQANVKPGYTFEKWANTTGGEVVLTTPSGRISMDGKKDLTAYATLNTYDGSVTLNKDGSVWPSSGKTVTLSTSDTDVAGVGYKTVSTDAGGVYSFTALSPLVTYYVWMDGNYTGQTVTTTDKNVALEYYTVSLTSGTNITAISGGGVYLKGTEITVSATVQAGDYVFSRWQNTAGGAMVSATNPYTFTVNSAVSLTAVSGATKYTATVTLKKDGADWTTSPRNIVLSTSSSALEGTVTGTASGNTYTFPNLPGTGTYYVWDAETVTYTGKQISSTGASAELEYFTVTVTPSGNIASVMGAGTYLKGSSVTVTVTPVDYYLITGAGWVNGKFTINNISAAQTINPAAALDTYTGTVNVKKDNEAWTATTATIVLSTSSTDREAGKLTTAGVSGVFTAANLDPTKTYYVWAGDAYTGRVLSRASSSVVVDYYTISVTATNATVNGAGVYLAGSPVTLTVDNVTAGYEFVGWYSGTALLSTGTTFTVSNLISGQALTAQAANDYTATVVVSGAVKSITLNDGTAINPDSGTSGTFSGLDRGVTYSVYANGADTGKTVSKSARGLTLLYYTVSLTAGPGVSSVTGSNTYLAGSNADINATLENDYTFTGWKGSESYSEISTTISSIDKNYTLVASAYRPYGGEPFDVSGGSITISDSDTEGKIKVVQGGITTDDIDPTKTFPITGTSTTNNITIDATRGATIILNNLDINVAWSAIGITNTAGHVTLLLSDTNKLNSQNSVALLKENTAALTIQSVDGTVNHSLTASASGVGSAGIGRANPGGNSALVTSNITINSGFVTATGNGAGIGVWQATTSNITITGGIVNGSVIGGVSQGSNTVLSNLTVTGGTVNAAINATKNTGVNNVIKGGSINGNINTNVLPTDGAAPAPASVYKVTLSTGLQNTDISGRLNITKSGDDNFSYGTKDMWTTNDVNGNVNLYLSNGTYTATLGSNTKIIVVGDANKTDTLIATYSVTTPVVATAEDIAASATPSPGANIKHGATVTVNVSLSGTAQKPGTYTVGLTGTGIGTVAAQTFDVTKNQNVSTSKTFSFTMPDSNVTDLALTLSFSEEAKHTASYYNGSTLLGSAAYYAGDTYTMMDGSGLNKTGYTFGGWGVSGDQTMGTSDVTHTVVWSPNTYKVVFHNDGAETEQSFTYNAVATALNGSFAKTGYTLSGWAETLNGPKAYSVNATVQNLTSAMDGTVDLYAVWQAQDCSVSFANGGGTGEMAPQSFLHGVAQELTSNGFTRTGYTFTGWTDGTTTYVNGQSFTATGNITLTAQWAANSYRVVFNGNGANGGSTMASQSFSYGASQSLTNNTYTRDGYTFGGWATTSNGSKVYDNGESVQNLTAAQNGTVTLYAVWTPNTYTVNFNAGTSGSGTMGSQNHTYDAAQALTKNGFTRSGYSFSGWNTQTNGTGLQYADEASVVNLAMTGSVTLYAQWTAETYSLAFNSSNGVGSMDNQNFATGDGGKVSANRFVNPGYTFDGWNTKVDGTGTNYAANASLMDLDNLTDANPALYAKWRANSYTVVFNANGGTESMGNQNFTYNVSQNLTANSFTRGSDTFLGWSTSSTAETTTYTDGQSVSNLSTIADGKITLYAVWRANTYEVRFDANAGSGDMLPQTIGRSVATPLNTNVYTRSGYSFTGWNTSINGSGLSYADGHQVTNLPGDTANSITLYAQWTESVRYNLNGTVKESGGALLSGATVKLMQGSTIVAQTMTGADGIYFFGNLRSGSYNVVATKDGKTVTKLAVITGNMTQDMVLPAAAANNSVLVVTNDPSAEIIPLTVGGLDELASIESADITMTITAKVEDGGDGEQLAIKEKSGSQVVGIYLDMTVKKGLVTQTSTANVLEIVIPFNFSGKTDINVYRYHGGQAVPFTKLTDKPVTPFTDGNFYLDSVNGLIHVYTSQFSTYAVTYTGVSSGGGGGGGTSAHPVNIDTAGITGGSVKADKSTAVFGEKVTITVTPDKDYKLSGLSVIDASGKQITFTDNGDGTYTFTMPASAVTVSLVFGSADSTFPFVDVSETHWAREAIAWANENGLFSGTTATTFGPGISTTRGMVVTVLWRMENEPSVMKDTTFADVSAEAYYGKAVDWANKNGVVLGYGNGLFGPKNTITREQMAAILYRYAQLKGYDVSKRTKLDSFTDGGKTTGYAQTAMEWAVANNIISGKENKILDPKGKATRAEVAVILMRFTELNK